MEQTKLCRHCKQPMCRCPGDLCCDCALGVWSDAYRDAPYDHPVLWYTFEVMYDMHRRFGRLVWGLAHRMGFNATAMEHVTLTRRAYPDWRRMEAEDRAERKSGAPVEPVEMPEV